MNDDKRTRHWMRIETSAIALTPKAGSRVVTADDAAALGDLMFDSYLSTIDDEGYTREENVQEMKDTFTGKYGVLLDFASFVIDEDGEITSASIITLYKGKPLLAEALTKPGHQGKGLGGHLIQRSLDALAAAGYTELYLVVTEGNPAEKLYVKLGFKKSAVAKPKAPPPAP